MRECPKCKSDACSNIKCYRCGYTRQIRKVFTKEDDRNCGISNENLKRLRYRVTRPQMEAIFERWKNCGHWRTKSYLSYRRKWRHSWETLMAMEFGITIGIESDGYMHS